MLAQLGEASEALNRLREGEQLLERQAARGIVGYRGWAYHSLGRAALLLGRLDEARRLGDRAVESSPCRHGFAAHALHLLGDIATHPDRFDAESGEAHYREALALAEPRGMRPLVAHCHLGLGKLYRRTGKRRAGARAPHHRDDDVPRDGHAVLAGAGGDDRERLSLARAEIALGVGEQALEGRRQLDRAADDAGAVALQPVAVGRMAAAGHDR